MNEIKRTFYRNGFLYSQMAKKGNCVSYSMSRNGRIVMYDVFDVITDADGNQSLQSRDRIDPIYSYADLINVWARIGNGVKPKKVAP